MKILVYEAICAGGLGEAPPASLRAEGWAMLRAVAHDFATVADVTTLLTTDFPPLAGIRCERTAIPDSRSRLERLIAEHDAVLPIAPETGGLLASLAERVVEHDRILLGCSPDSIRLTADKLALARHWRSGGVATPETQLVSSAEYVAFPAVLKPRDGAGSQATRLIEHARDWPRAVEDSAAECPDAEWIVQPYRPGKACSMAFLIGPRQIVPLLPTAQRLSADGRFRYLGGTLPLESRLSLRESALNCDQGRRPGKTLFRGAKGDSRGAKGDSCSGKGAIVAESADRVQRIAERALAGLDRLAGFVGVDCVLGDDGIDVAIEINPRVTTSYVGLRALCRGNLADAWLRLASGAEDVVLEWKPGVVSFDAAGAVAPRLL